MIEVLLFKYEVGCASVVFEFLQEWWVCPQFVQGVDIVVDVIFFECVVVKSYQSAVVCEFPFVGGDVLETDVVIVEYSVNDSVVMWNAVFLVLGALYNEVVLGATPLYLLQALWCLDKDIGVYMHISERHLFVCEEFPCCPEECRHPFRYAERVNLAVWQECKHLFCEVISIEMYGGVESLCVSNRGGSTPHGGDDLPLGFCSAFLREHWCSPE